MIIFNFLSVILLKPLLR